MKQLTIILTFLLAVTQAFAQQQQTVPQRSGFIISAMAGVGSLSLSGDVTNTSDGFGISLPNVKVGTMLSPNTALLLNLPGMQYEQNGKDRSIDALALSLQYWVKPSWWINGGAGISMDTRAFYEKNNSEQDKLNVGPAVVFGTGYEFYRRARFSIDLQANLQAGRVYSKNDHRDGIAVLTGVGFNFY